MLLLSLLGKRFILCERMVLLLILLPKKDVYYRLIVTCCVYSGTKKSLRGGLKPGEGYSLQDTGIYFNLLLKPDRVSA